MYFKTIFHKAYTKWTTSDTPLRLYVQTDRHAFENKIWHLIMGIKTLYIKAPQYENVNNCSLGNGVSFFRGVDVLWQCFFACYEMTCVAQFTGGTSKSPRMVFRVMRSCHTRSSLYATLGSDHFTCVRVRCMSHRTVYVCLFIGCGIFLT